MNASGGSGNYKYRLASLMTVEDGQLVSVYDISYGNNVPIGKIMNLALLFMHLVHIISVSVLWI